MKKILLGMVLSLATALSLMAQTRAITGRVTSAEEPEGIPGVSVIIKGSTLGAITDLDGRFSLQAPSNAETLVFSFVGYMTKEVAIGGLSTIEVSLDADVKTLGEVVVVGYGTQSKRTVTGSIASVAGSQIANAPVQSFDQALQGKVPGVNIITPNGVLNNPPVI